MNIIDNDYILNDATKGQLDNEMREILSPLARNGGIVD